MIIISNGYQKFHLAWAASEADRRGLLSVFITCAYPTKFVRRILTACGLTTNVKIRRLLAREEPISETRVVALWGPELLYQVSVRISRLPVAGHIGLKLHTMSMRWYGRSSVRIVINAAKQGAKVYHYRAGFGHKSVIVAKRLGLITLCDHSIAHPAVLDWLITHDGRMPPINAHGKMNKVWADILRDIELADAVLVNSNFVKSTFINRGWNDSKLHVIYQGVDDAFLGFTATLPRKRHDATEPLKLLFPGSIFNNRKGAAVLMQALALLPRDLWNLNIAGGIDPTIRTKNPTFFSDPRVSHIGTLSRSELARAIVDSDAVVLPSLAEGSARVIFEALACGRYVITTPNSGSVVRDGIEGTVVPAGDPYALADAIKHLALIRPTLDDFGKRNAELIRSRFRQSTYGASLERLYKQLLSK